MIFVPASLTKFDWLFFFSSKQVINWSCWPNFIKKYISWSKKLKFESVMIIHRVSQILARTDLTPARWRRWAQELKQEWNFFFFHASFKSWYISYWKIIFYNKVVKKPSEGPSTKSLLDFPRLQYQTAKYYQVSYFRILLTGQKLNFRDYLSVYNIKNTCSEIE